MSKTMQLSVQKIHYSTKFQGKFKGIKPTETRWFAKGVEHIKYGFTQSGGRFERENIAYEFTVKASYGDKTQTGRELLIGTIDWPAMDTPGDIYKEFLDSVKIDQIKRMFRPSDQELENLVIEINNEIKKCIRIFKDQYYNSEEHEVSKQNRRRVDQWMKAKLRFDQEYGSGYFEEIYDFDLDLKNVDLLERIRLRKGPKDSYRQEQNHDSGGSREEEKSENSSDSTNLFSYTEEEMGYLKKFYKTLAKNYHPDICHDDGKAMQFLNKLKTHWNL